MTFIPRSLDHTMFIDGLAYAAISRNMSVGTGSFWAPYFADSFWLDYNNLCSFFCEHPPLMFGMQSLIFRLIGDSTAVENIYNGIILACIVTLIVSVWRVLFRNDEQVRRHAWLPVLMWYGLRIVWWSVPNNMLDTSLAMFCLASCYTQLLVLSKKRYANGYWILSGILVLLACLTKGPVGLFPLAFPVLYDLIFKNSRRRIFGGALTLLATVAILTFAVLQYPPARSLLKSYFDGQVMMALLKKEKVAKRIG